MSTSKSDPTYNIPGIPKIDNHSLPTDPVGKKNDPSKAHHCHECEVSGCRKHVVQCPHHKTNFHYDLAICVNNPHPSYCTDCALGLPTDEEARKIRDELAAERKLNTARNFNKVKGTKANAAFEKFFAAGKVRKDAKPEPDPKDAKKQSYAAIWASKKKPKGAE